MEKFEQTRTYQAACIYVRLNRYNFLDFRLWQRANIFRCKYTPKVDPKKHKKILVFNFNTCTLINLFIMFMIFSFLEKLCRNYCIINLAQLYLNSHLIEWLCILFFAQLLSVEFSLILKLYNHANESLSSDIPCCDHINSWLGLYYLSRI